MKYLIILTFLLATGCTWVTSKGSEDNYIITVTTTRKNTVIEKTIDGEKVTIDGKLIPLKEKK